jgi:hypothetical protein
MQVARDPTKIFKNSACDQHDDNTPSSNLSYGFADVRIENIVLGDRPIEIESQY